MSDSEEPGVSQELNTPPQPIVEHVWIPIRARNRRGRLYRAADDGRPAMVFAHGSGPGHDGAIEQEAKTFASLGVTVLVPEKVMDGYSGIRRDYEALAQDLADAARWLRQQPWHQNASIGVFGYSEGTWIAILAAASHPDLMAFCVLASGPIVSPGEQIRYDYRVRVAASSRGARMVHGLFWRLYTSVVPYCRFDARPLLTNMRTPVFALWGEKDPSLQIDRAISVLNATSRSAICTTVVPDAGHYLGTGRWITDAAEWIRHLKSPAEP